MAEVAALATPSIRRQIGNKGRIAEQGALTWVLHSQAAKWKDRVQLERNFTMNGNWMDYAGKWVKGGRRLSQAVWGNDQVPFVVQYAGCQVRVRVCVSHSRRAAGRASTESLPLALSLTPPSPTHPHIRCAAGIRRMARGTTPA